MGNFFSSQTNAAQGASQGLAQNAAQNAAQKYIYNTQRDIVNMSPDDIKNINFKDVNH